MYKRISYRSGRAARRNGSGAAALFAALIAGIALGALLFCPAGDTPPEGNEKARGCFFARALLRFYAQAPRPSFFSLPPMTSARASFMQSGIMNGTTHAMSAAPKV